MKKLLLAGLVVLNCWVAAAQCTIVPPNPQVCQGNVARFTAVGAGTVSWTGPNGFTSTGANVEIQLASSLNAGVYTATINNQGVISTCTATLVVNPAPLVAIVPLNQTVTPGGSATFTVQLNSLPGPAMIYWWSPTRGVIGMGQTVTLTNVQAADSGLVFAMVVDLNYCGVVTAAGLQVRSQAGLFNPQSSSSE